MVGTGVPKSNSCVTITAWLISIEGNAGVDAFVAVAPGTAAAATVPTAFVA